MVDLDHRGTVVVAGTVVAIDTIQNPFFACSFFFCGQGSVGGRVFHCVPVGFRDPHPNDVLALFVPGHVFDLSLIHI